MKLAGTAPFFWIACRAKEHEQKPYLSSIDNLGFGYKFNMRIQPLITAELFPLAGTFLVSEITTVYSMDPSALPSPLSLFSLFTQIFSLFTSPFSKTLNWCSLFLPTGGEQFRETHNLTSLCKLQVLGLLDAKTCAICTMTTPCRVGQTAGHRALGGVPPGTWGLSHVQRPARPAGARPHGELGLL